jgi:hypothetical protein
MAAVTLLAMAPSGEILFYRDPDGRVWLVRSEAAGGVELSDGDTAARAVAFHGFLDIDRAFDTLADLEAFRQAKAAEILPEEFVIDDDLDAVDVREMLDEAKSWIADGDGQWAWSLGLKLLRVPAVRNDAVLNDEVIRLVEDSRKPRLDVGAPEVSPATQVAVQRWHDVRDKIAV